MAFRIKNNKTSNAGARGRNNFLVLAPEGISKSNGRAIKNGKASVDETGGARQNEEAIVNLVQHSRLGENHLSMEPSIIERAGPLCFMYSPKDSGSGPF